MSENCAAEIPKKRPGRPRKKPSFLQPTSGGILQAPQDARNSVEFTYQHPAEIKRIVNLFKAYNTINLELEFAKNQFTISGKDYTNRVTIIAAVNCRYVSSYYCAEPCCVSVKRDKFEIALAPLEKSHSQITICINRHGNTTLCIVLHDTLYNSDDQFEIESPQLTQISETPSKNFDDATYPVRFVISGAHLKNKIKDLKYSVRDFSIQKQGNEPLRICMHELSRFAYSGIYTDPDKIHLESSIADCDIFVSVVPLSYIRPLTSPSLTEDLIIAADSQRKMIVRTGLGRLALEADDYAIQLTVAIDVLTSEQAARYESPAAASAAPQETAIAAPQSESVTKKEESSGKTQQTDDLVDEDDADDED
ncbi:MAG: hypothetical protein M0R33_14085 [Methylomonas sp.]|jgi:hypothetical protein|uniref:hypothetical protein n=1 Tax=Methylomonas sp. TaxID=418 RepID=UPI0025D2FEDE|nr:hypothetical protein [Methylomonas sp.]MCK9607566.1 hypothetical protein [Methylomonas sp.]